MPKPKPRTINLPDGTSAKAVEMDFKIVREDWNEYELSDGTRLRVKNFVVKVLVVVDDNGEYILGPVGDPQVMVQGSVNVVASVMKEGEP